MKARQADQKLTAASSHFEKPEHCVTNKGEKGFLVSSFVGV